MPRMSMSPSSILSKLEELRKWQEKQQERLLEQHSQPLEQNNFTATERQFLQNSLALNLSVEQTEKSPKINERSTRKPLPKESNKSLGKRRPQPFLRRGAGLARFRMNPGEQFKPFTKFERSNQNSSVTKPSSISKVKLNGVSQKDKSTITPLKVPDVSIKPRAAWFMTEQSESQKPIVNTEEMMSNSRNHTGPNLDASAKELFIFETLEQRAVQNSFCSTNSSIIRLLSSTPQKNSPKQWNENSSNVFQQSGSQDIYENGKQLEAAAAAHQQSAAIHYAQFSQNNQTPIIEEVVDDFFETNAKAVEQNAQKLQGIDSNEKKLQNELLDLIEKAIKFKEYVANGDGASNTSSSTVTSEDLEIENTLQPPRCRFNDEKTWSDTETCSSAHSSANANPSWEHWPDKCDVQTMTDFADNEPIETDNAESLKKRFEDLEKELKSIQRENAKIGKLKSQLDQQRREFERHKKEIVKQVEDEKVRIAFTLEEEKKKLAKERMVFERYVKESRGNPSKKEREEIAVLKSEISALQETLKLKESRNGTSLARLRNQIRALEKENAALKSEVDKLNRQNGKLLASQKVARHPTETQMLHEINKNITKLAQEQLSIKVARAEKNQIDDEVDEIKSVKKSKEPDKPAALLRRQKSESEEKENNRNTSNNRSKSMSNLNNVEETYDRTFRSDYEVASILSNVNQNEIKKNDRTEVLLDDGTKQIEYSNGNVKTISPDGNHIVFKYYNGDIKETKLLEGTVRYYYHASKVNHTTNADGTELIEFPDGQTERRLKNRCEVQYPNGIIRRTQSTGTEEICYPDGTAVTVNMQGDRILQLPNGQKEIHTKEHKRREYPDGTVKILYPDGLQETRYANGRVRLKDKNGKLLMDSHNYDTVEV